MRNGPRGEAWSSPTSDADAGRRVEDAAADAGREAAAAVAGRVGVVAAPAAATASANDERAATESCGDGAPDEGPPGAAPRPTRRCAGNADAGRGESATE